MIRWLLAAGIGCVGLAVGAGFIASGGVTEGRLERLDRERRADLRRVQVFLLCAQDPGPLPMRLDDAAFCPERQDRAFLTDPGSGALYAYARKSDREFEVCAQTQSRQFRHRTLYPSAYRIDGEGRLCITGTRD